ncbi:hypothetical protein FQA39_LY18874 [Lamprigera yunnana]|nr:hypothetical protein FQA39_LY18874 [Lamprigera yunnana]
MEQGNRIDEGALVVSVRATDETIINQLRETTETNSQDKTTFNETYDGMNGEEEPYDDKSDDNYVHDSDEKSENKISGNEMTTSNEDEMIQYPEPAENILAIEVEEEVEGEVELRETKLSLMIVIDDLKCVGKKIKRSLRLGLTPSN